MFNGPGSGTVKPGYGRILTFAIGGTATLKAPAYTHKDPPTPPTNINASTQVVKEGNALFNSHCASCHGINAVAGPLPDLRYSSRETLEGIEGIVLGGSRASAGMPSFKDVLDSRQVQAIQGYIVSRARELARPAEGKRN